MLHQIGAGTLGPVFRAYQPDPGRLVAVKLFRLDLAPDNAHRFVAALERLIAADLGHLGIAAPIAAGMSDGLPFLAMDFVAADAFDVVVRDYGPAPPAEALRIATQLGGALDFAAAVDVFHGCLHARDVLVSNEDTRVTGLGIAQALEPLGIATPVRRPYSAPERVAGEPWDRRADVFSLAALVYEMLCGRRVAGTADEAAAAVPALPGADTRGLRQVFARALAERPDDRFDTALGFVDALHGVFDQAATAAPPKRRRRGDETASRVAGRASLPLDGAEPDAYESHQAGAAALRADPALVDDLELDRARDARVELAESAPSVPSLFLEPLPDETPALETLDQPDTVGPARVVELDTAETRPADAHSAGAQAVDAPAGPGRITDGLSGVELPPAGGRTVVVEESRSTTWPIALALTVGLLVGFAFGFGVGTRERASDGMGPAEARREAEGDPAPARDPAPAEAPAPAEGAGSPPVPVPPAVDAAPNPAAGSVAAAPAPPVAPAPARAAQSRPADAPAARRLQVRSTPPGARVILDGREAGTTPLTLRDVRPGAHVVRISHQGYVPAERRVRISAAQPAQSIDVTLVAARDSAARGGRAAAPEPTHQPERSSGALMIDSRPGGARVFVDGKLVGTTPMLLDAVIAGDHAVRLELDGFSPWTAAVTVAPGERARVSGSLDR